MSVFKRGDRWVSKFQHRGAQQWTPGGPWKTKTQARNAERHHRDFLEAQRTEETCANFTDRWLIEWVRPSASTQRVYAAAVGRFAEDFGPTPLSKVGRVEARAWALTVPRNVSRVISTMFSDAMNVGLVDANPFANMRLPAIERKAEITAPTMDDYRAVLDACPVLGGYGPEFKAMVQVAAWTGIRQGELFGLQWPEVAETEITIRQSRKLDGGLGLPKNGQARTIPLLPPARALDQVPRRPNDEFVFHSPQGRPLLKGTFAWSWQKVKAAARVDARWHDWRHFCATELLELGIDHFAVSIQLGHTDGGQLVQARYGHPSTDAAKERLQAAFEFDPVNIGSKSGSNRAAK